MFRQPRNQIGTHEVHVWHLLAENVRDVSILNATQELLSEHEHERMTCLRQEGDRLLYLLSRGLMRSVLASYLSCDGRDVRFSADSHGKPILCRDSLPGAPALQFNLTHSRGAVVFAVSGGPEIGVDIEERHRSVEYLALAERYFAPDEARHLRSLPAAEVAPAFFAIWTLKEAFVKGIGRGLSFPLDAFCFDLDATRLVRFRPLADFVSPDWQFQQFDLGDRHCGALAVRKPENGALVIELRDWRHVFLAQ